MVGWLRWSGRRGWRPKVSQAWLLGFPLLEAAMPEGREERRLLQGARALHRRGVVRVLPAPGIERRELLARCGLTVVDPLPLCRAKGAELALALLNEQPLRVRRAALRGREADAMAWTLADVLCPQVGALLLDFERGEERLARHLREVYGAAPLHLGQGPPPQVSLELTPCGVSVGRALRLWGIPELQGMELVLKGERLPPDIEPLLFLELLWESGRISLKEVSVRQRWIGLDRRE